MAAKTQQLGLGFRDISTEGVICCRECDMDKYSSRCDARCAGWTEFIKENPDTHLGITWTAVCPDCARQRTLSA